MGVRVGRRCLASNCSLQRLHVRKDTQHETMCAPAPAPQLAIRTNASGPHLGKRGQLPTSRRLAGNTPRTTTGSPLALRQVATEGQGICMRGSADVHVFVIFTKAGFQGKQVQLPLQPKASPGIHSGICWAVAVVRQQVTHTCRSTSQCMCGQSSRTRH